MNQNPEQSGFFEESGRVKCIKLRGIASEGFIMPPYKKYYVRKLTFEEQYVYQKKLYGIYFNYDINYLNQFLPKSDLSGIDLDAPGYEQVLGYEQKIIEDSERVKKD